MQRVTDILNAFELLLVNSRFEDITMEEVAATAGIQIGSLYHFFADKTSVAVTVLERALFDEGTVFRLSPEDEELDLRSYLQVLEQRMTDVWRSHGKLLDLYFAVRTTSPGVAMDAEPTSTDSQAHWRQAQAVEPQTVFSACRYAGPRQGSMGNGRID